MQVSHSVRSELDRFFISIEKRAFFRAKLAVGNDDDAIELVQDAMLKLVMNYADKPEEEWRFLFNKLLENRIIDWHRQQKVRNRWQSLLAHFSSGKNEEQDSLEEGNNGIDQAEDQHALNAVEKLIVDRSMEECVPAIQQLPLRQQQAFILRQWEGLSVAETAKIMECSEGSVKTHLHRALQQLRSAITEYRDNEH